MWGSTSSRRALATIRTPPCPAQGGNVGIAGHRTTYGAPFFRIDELAAGDDVIVYQPSRPPFAYKVTEQFIVSPSQYEVLAPSDHPILTLTSCHPRYSAKKRIIVQAALDPSRSAPLDVAPPSTTPPTVPPTDAAPPATLPGDEGATTVPPTTTASAAAPATTGPPRPSVSPHCNGDGSTTPTRGCRWRSGAWPSPASRWWPGA